MRFQLKPHLLSVLFCLASVLVSLFATTPAVGQVDSQNMAGGENSWVQAAAREEAQLVNLRDAMNRQVQQLEQRRLKRMREVESQRKVQDAERAQLAVQADELKAKLEEYERRQKQSLQGAHMEAARQKLKKFLDKYHGETSPAQTGTTETWNGFVAEIERAERVLRQSQAVRVEAGSFLDREGHRRQGSIVHLGQTAAFGEAEGRSVIVAPDGKSGWLELTTAEPSMVKAMINGGIVDSLYAFVYDSVSQRSDLNVAASFADRAAGWVPLVWLSLLGLAVAGLFVAIARS